MMRKAHATLTLLLLLLPIAIGSDVRSANAAQPAVAPDDAAASPPAQVPSRNFSWVSKTFDITTSGINDLGGLAVAPDGTVFFTWSLWRDTEFVDAAVWSALARPNKAGKYKVKKPRQLSDFGADPVTAWIDRDLQAFWTGLGGSIEGQRIKPSGKPRGNPKTIVDTSGGSISFGAQIDWSNETGTGLAFGSLLGSTHVVKLQQLNAKQKPKGSPQEIHDSGSRFSFPIQIDSIGEDCRLVVVREKNAEETAIVSRLKLLDADGNVLDEEGFEGRILVETNLALQTNIVVERKDDGSLHMWEYEIDDATSVKFIAANYWGKASPKQREYLTGLIIAGNSVVGTERIGRADPAVAIAYNSTDKRLELVRVNRATQTTTFETLMKNSKLSWVEAAWVNPGKGDANMVIFWEQMNADDDWSIHARFAEVH